jgi:cephalosporin hydroxylase
VVAAYHRVIYPQRFTWKTTSFEGYPVLKFATDLWTYQEWIYQLKPQLIIETGTAFGGSALYFARMIDRLNDGGLVVTIDVEEKPNRPRHPRVKYWQGSSTDAEIVRELHLLKERMDNPRTMVVLDSRHDAEHVGQELALYAGLVSPGQLLVVEDTNISYADLVERPVVGPAHALSEWLPLHTEFQVEPLCERWLLTCAPGGWLRRVA